MSKHLAGSTVSVCMCVYVCVCAPPEIYCNVSREADCKQRALRLIDWPNYNKTTLGYHSNRSINKEPLSSDAHTHGCLQYCHRL